MAVKRDPTFSLTVLRAHILSLKRQLYGALLEMTNVMENDVDNLLKCDLDMMMALMKDDEVQEVLQKAFDKDKDKQPQGEHKS